MAATRNPKRVALLAVRISGLWILLGALAKLFFGTPADLPAPVRAFPLPLDLTFWGAIAVELAVSLAAIFHPRAAWPFLSAVLLLFVAVLVKLVAAGAKSCGCFGPTIPFPPALMLAIDVACLGKILFAKPWSSLPRPRLQAARIAAALGPSFFLPLFVLGPPPLARAANPPAQRSGPGEKPRSFPRWVTLEPDKWIGRPIGETELARWMSTGDYPGDATWILYRINCPVCAEHLRKLAMEFDGTRMYVLVRLPERDDEKNREVDALPATDFHAVLPSQTAWVIQTPWELELEGGVVRKAVEIQPRR